jgi:hypothetical protein
MSDNLPPIPIRRLSEVVRDVKIAAAERSDVVVEMRDAEQARLEILAKALEPVIADVPADDDQFDFALSQGLRPRFWIDAVTHVRMGRDRRTYSLVRDTRAGRTIVAEDADIARMTEAVSRYIAERMVQRQRVLEGDWDEQSAQQSTVTGERPVSRMAPATPSRPIQESAVPGSDTTPSITHRHPPTPKPAAHHQPAQRGAGFVIGLLWFITGCVAGGLALLAAFWERLGA